MTRGKFVLITEDQVYISIEFNGDMYPSGHGIEVMNRLKKVHTPDDFISEVTGFNKENFQYKDKLIYTESLAWFKKFKDFRIDYLLWEDYEKTKSKGDEPAWKSLLDDYTEQQATDICSNEVRNIRVEVKI